MVRTTLICGSTNGEMVDEALNIGRRLRIAYADSCKAPTHSSRQYRELKHMADRSPFATRDQRQMRACGRAHASDVVAAGRVRRLVER